MHSVTFPNRDKAVLFLTLFCFLVLCTATASGQTEVAIRPLKSDTLFIGVDNPISLTAAHGVLTQASVSIRGGGKLSPTGNGNYRVRVTEETDSCIISVTLNGKEAGSATFKVRALPAPAATIGGFATGGSVPAAAFRQQAGLGLYLKNFPLPVRYEVLGFTLKVDDGNGSVRTADSKSSLFSEQAKQYIRLYVKPGKTVTIDKIRAKDQSGREHKLPPLVYAIR